MSIQFKDNSKAIKSQLQSNMKPALTAMGYTGVEITLDTMNKRYPKKIYLSGDMQRDLTFEVDVGEQKTTWGIPENYAVPVHEGTAHMAGRPFFRDGIYPETDQLRDVAADELKKGF